MSATKRIVTIIFLILIVVVVFQLRRENVLKWHQENDYRWAQLPFRKGGKPGFKQLSASETRITFSNQLTRDQITNNRHLLNGSGVAVGDVNGDGLVDIYFCRLNGPNILYKNLGNWKFEDITADAGVACLDQFSTGTALADIDGDGDLDLLVTTLGGPHFCFLNDGLGNFTDVTNSSGLMANTGATSQALADIDGDGDLDLYVTNYKKSTVKDHYLPQELEFDRIVKKVGSGYEIIPEFQEHYTVKFLNNNILMRYEYAEPDKLYLNDGKGHFQVVSFTDGRFLDVEGKPVSEPKDWGLMVRFQDIDEDGDPDIYVCNDFESQDRIWINDGSGNFQAISKLAIRNISWATMGIDFSDIDRDNDLDFLLLDMLSRDHQQRHAQSTHSAPISHVIGAIDNRPQYSRNTLFLNRGDGTYAEIAQLSDVQASGWSWSPIFLDVDLDGYEDIIIATGHFYDALNTDVLARIRATRYRSLETWRNKIFEFPSLSTPNIAFHNRGDLTFEEVGDKWGFSTTDISHGIALGDFDNDGDLDIVLNRFNAPAGVYRNETVSPRLAIRLRGHSPNTRGIGAKIQVLGGPIPQSKEVICAGIYLSSSDPLYVFATGEADKDLTIRVVWRNGTISVIQNLKANRIYEIDESSAYSTDITQGFPVFGDELFSEDVSNIINDLHRKDKNNDLIIGSERGTRGVFHNDDKGQFHHNED